MSRGAGAWTGRVAPSLADLEALANRAFADLPDPFRQACHGLVIRVEDFPDEATLDEMECETEFDLLGLFRGVGLAQAGAGGRGPSGLPNRIWLYRRPILDYWAEHEETLDAVVTHVLVHEIGHHLGHSDDDLYGIEASANAAE